MIDDHALSKPELRRSKPGRADFAVQARNPITVVLDGVRGNYNIGAIFRLCDAFLVERLIICGEESQARPHRVPALLRKRKLVQAAVGTQRWVPWQEEPDAGTVVRTAKAAGHWIAVVELTAESVSLTAMQPRYPAALVLGNERSGVSQEVLARSGQSMIAQTGAIRSPGRVIGHSANQPFIRNLCADHFDQVLRDLPAARASLPLRDLVIGGSDRSTSFKS